MMELEKDKLRKIVENEKVVKHLSVVLLVLIGISLFLTVPVMAEDNAEVTGGKDCDSNSPKIGAAADGTCDGDDDGLIDATAGGMDCDDSDPDAGKRLGIFPDREMDNYWSEVIKGCEIN